LGLFSIDPRLQGRGLGSALLSRAEEEAKVRFNATTCVLHVLMPRTELIAFYERRGYRPTGVQTPFPAQEGREVVLVETLNLMEFKKTL
jgi:ribosomal protein S18 acetylase RimI-like enzyme